MMKVLIGSLLVATTTLAQTPRQQAKMEGKTNSPMSRTVASTLSSSTQPTAGADTRPLPQTTRKQKLQSRDNAIPTYRIEKEHGVHKSDVRYPRKKKTSDASKKEENQ